MIFTLPNIGGRTGTSEALLMSPEQRQSSVGITPSTFLHTP